MNAPLTRREFLAGIGGAAVVGCRRPRPTLAGGIVGGPHPRGHLLRDPVRRLSVSNPMPERHTGVAIIGAGIAGLSAAWALERAGYRDYTLLELDDQPGGTAHGGDGAITRYPWGAHYVPVPRPDNRAMVALLAEVGAVAGRDPGGDPVYAEDVLCREPSERVFYRGEWYEGLYPRVAAAPADTAAMAAFTTDIRRWATFRDRRGRRAFDLPRARGSDDDVIRALDRLSMAEYLRQHHASNERLRWFVEYACRDDFGTTLEHTSAWAGLHYFAARRDEEDEPAPVLTWPEGNGRLVAHLAAGAGARLVTGAVVTGVAEDGRDGVRVVWVDPRDGRTQALTAAHAIVALPRFVAERVVEPRPETANPATYSPWMVANLTLRDRLHERSFPLAWDNVLYDSPSLGYVTATHQLGRDHGPTVLTYYLPFVGDNPAAERTAMLATPWESWVDRIRADLGRAHPDLDDLLERVDVYLWGHGMVRPVPGSMWGDAYTPGRECSARIQLAHTDRSGMALFEEAQYWGIRAAEAVLTREGQPFVSWHD